MGIPNIKLTDDGPIKLIIKVSGRWRTLTDVLKEFMEYFIHAHSYI